MEQYSNRYNVLASHFVNGKDLEHELFAGFLTHVNDPRYCKYEEYLERCTITILVRGSATYMDNFLPKINFKSGMIIFRPKGSIYSIERMVERGDYLEYVINLPDVFAQVFYESQMLPATTKLYKISLDDYFIQRCNKLSETLNRVTDNYLGEYLLALSDFLDHIYHIVNKDIAEDKDSKLLLKACRLLEDNFNDIISFSLIAKQLGVSERKLRYLFTNKLNTSPKKYHMRYKFIYAENLLINSKMTIKEISAILGYTNQQNFSRQFKELYSISPEEFRKKEISNS